MAVEVKVKKGTKKAFYDVETPLTAIRISLYGSSIGEFDGRIVKLDLTRSLRGKSLELRMKVIDDNGVLKAIPISSRLASSYIRRAMRRGIDYVEDSFKTECRDAIVIVKPFLITRMRVSRAIRKALRDNARKYLETYMKSRNTKELFSEIMTNKLQKNMSIKLKKIYPLAMCEIRVFEVKGEKAIEGSEKALENGIEKEEMEEKSVDKGLD